MALDHTALATGIKDAIKKNVSELDEKYAFKSDNPFGNAFIEAIAEAVVAHIKANGKVTFANVKVATQAGSQTPKGKGDIE